mmetsp:Transcript_81031/g.241447  ORF Transcript_81031/g.241447 Transcript_81031/m.241447 type:complete len:204 (+) Transcript_81031:450-1061(+)
MCHQQAECHHEEAKQPIQPAQETGFDGVLGAVHLHLRFAYANIKRVKAGQQVCLACREQLCAAAQCVPVPPSDPEAVAAEVLPIDDTRGGVGSLDEAQTSAIERPAAERGVGHNILGRHCVEGRCNATTGGCEPQAPSHRDVEHRERTELQQAEGCALLWQCAEGYVLRLHEHHQRKNPHCLEIDSKLAHSVHESYHLHEDDL